MSHIKKDWFKINIPHLFPLEFPDSANREIRKNISALTAGYLTKQLGLFPFEALKEAIRQIQKPKIVEINLGILAHFE